MNRTNAVLAFVFLLILMVGLTFRYLSQTPSSKSQDLSLLPITDISPPTESGRLPKDCATLHYIINSQADFEEMRSGSKFCLKSKLPNVPIDFGKVTLLGVYSAGFVQIYTPERACALLCCDLRCYMVALYRGYLQRCEVFCAQYLFPFQSRKSTNG